MVAATELTTRTATFEHKLDDQLRLNRDRHVVGSRQPVTRPSGIAPVDPRQEIGHVAVSFRQARLHQLAGSWRDSYANHVADVHQIAGNVDAPAVDRDVAVANQLPGLSPARAKASRCTTLSSRRSSRLISASPVLPLPLTAALVILAELPFQHAVVVLDLLLFAQVDAVIGELAAAGLCMPGGDSRRSMAHLGVSQRVPLRNNFNPSRRQRRQTGPVIRAIVR